MKTVPTIRVADSTDTVVLADLPEEIALAMSDIASAAREGLLAMSVAAGMAVMAAMFEAESTEACGPKGKHNPDRVAVRHGSEKGSVALGRGGGRPPPGTPAGGSGSGRPRAGRSRRRSRRYRAGSCARPRPRWLS